MATMQDLETALAAADAAGDTEGATHLAHVIQRAMQDKSNIIPGTHIPETMPQAPEPTLGEKAIGAGEAALTALTGATGGTLGMLGGTAKGLGKQIIAGEYGTPEGAAAVEKAAGEGAAALTYHPRTAAGQEYARTLGEVAQQLAPLGAAGGEVATVSAAAKQVAPVASTATRGVAAPAMAKAAELVREKTAAPTPGTMQGVGAAGTDVATMRRTMAEGLPVPFTGGSAPTRGQASRDFAQLQFEKETAKLGEVGAPLRQRAENQTETMLQNFDALIDKPGAVHFEPRAIGTAVDKALVNKVNVVKGQINRAFEAARASGEMAAPVEMAPLARTLDDLSSFEGVAKNIAAARREAQRLGAVIADENGKLVPKEMTINDAETLRQFVNASTDWMDKREALMAKRINASIDSATEGPGGDLYKHARGLRARFAQEFENVGLTSRLLGAKGGTSERKIALEDVFDKVIVASPTDEMNKLRGTLLRAGPEGKQAWADMKAKGIDYIKQASLSASQRDSRGNPLLSPDKLNRIVKALDDEGKLESLYGKKQAQTLRDLAEISSVIYTAPPGAVNTSNTVSALRMALDTIGTGVLTGMPLPAVTALKEAGKYVKNRKLKSRIDDALNPERK